MATLSQAKTLGGVGSILVFIPFLSIVGYILIIVAVRDIADDLQDKTIFTNVLIAAVTGVIGALALVSVILAGAIAGLFTAGVSAIFGVISAYVVLCAFLIISAIFLRRAYDKMAGRLGVKMFATAGLLYLIGAVLSVVFVGFFVLFVANILQAIAYFSIPDEPPPQAGTGAPGPMAAPSLSPQAGATKFCVSCGSKIAANATFCNSCGAKQP